MARLSTDVDQELVAYLDRRFAELKSELKSEITGELRAEIAASAAETRRHFDVAADRLIDQKLDRFRGEVAEEFHRVDRRLLRLETRAIG